MFYPSKQRSCKSGMAMSSSRLFRALIVSCLFSLCVSADVIYLKVDASGLGNGSSWANAYTDLADAVTALNSAPAGSVLRIAGGFYRINATQAISAADFKISGGYRAATEGDPLCDPAEYQTIISGYNSGAQTWTRFDPVAGSTANLSVNTLVNGKINYPDETGDNAPNEYAFFYRRDVNIGLASDFFSIAANSGGEISGLVITGVRGKNAITIASSGTGTTVSNCLFTANCFATAISVGNTATPSVVTDCTFKFNTSSANSSSGVLFSGPGILENSIFDGCYVNDGFQCCLVDFGISGCIVRNCDFNRVYYYAGDNNRAASYNGCAAVFRPRSNNPLIVNCTIRNSITKTIQSNSYPAPLVNGRTGIFSNCVISNNIAMTYVTANRSYSMLSDPANGANGAIWTNSLFYGNSIRVMGKTSNSGYSDGEVAVGIVSNAKDSYSLNVFNCIFDSNSVELSAGADLTGLTVLRCRGVISQGVSGTANSSVLVDHCTFTGPSEEGMYDIVQFGLSHNKPFVLRNSIFQLTDSGVYASPFLVQRPLSTSLSALFAPLNVTIQNQTTSPSSDYAVTGLFYDKVPLNSSYEPMARTPGLMTTTDGLPRGARPLAAGVAEGKSLTVRIEPLDGGAVTAGGTQSVATGAEISSITVASQGGLSFDGWYYEGETTKLSDSLTLSGIVLDADKVVIAKFLSRAVDIVFDLDGKGVFTESGTDKLHVASNAGLDFPAMPTLFTIGDGWVFVSWNSTPAKVPDADAVSVGAKIVTKDLRYVYLTTTGAGNKDGTSWENAYDDFYAAYEDAAIWRGELRIGDGVYKLPVTVDLKSNVTIRGGFGDGETILTGDLELNDYWTTNNVKCADIVVDGSVVMPDDDDADPELLWRHVYTGTPVQVGFTDANSDDPVQNVGFRDLTIANFCERAVRLGAGTSAVFENVRFVANGHDDKSKDYIALSCAGKLRLDGCRFTGNYAALSLSAGATITNVISGTVFEHGRSFYSTCGGTISGAARTIVTNCLFRRNAAVGNMYYASTASAILVGSSANANIEIVDTVFEKNLAESGATGIVTVRHGQNGCSFERCRFSGNVYKATTPLSVGYEMDKLPGSSAISWQSYNRLDVRDSLFENNHAEVAMPQGAVTYNCHASAIGIGSGSQYVSGAAQILNTAFVGNELDDRSADALQHPVGTIATGLYCGTAKLGLVHCTFKDNSVLSSHSTAAEVSLKGDASESVTFLDDIFWSDAATYRPFAFQTPVPPQIWGCVIKSYDGTLFAEQDQYSFVRNVTSVAPVFSAVQAVGKNGIAMPALSGVSPAFGIGIAVYLDDLGVVRYMDGDLDSSRPWRSAMNRTDTASSVSGVNVDIRIPDAVGKARGRHVTPGAITAIRKFILSIM